MQPENIGKYRVLRLLGRGATGAVYLADDPFGERQVAIKVMEKPTADEHESHLAQRFFQTEAALAGKLRHPHIVSILDAGVSEDLHYLVMDFVDGTSLSDYCDSSNLLPVERIVGILYKCCKAMEYANEAGVVHRDIKPANIMVHGDLDIKIADFGAALMTRGDTTQVTGVGSPAYMSPEQIRDDDLDFRTDMFSVGAVCYHLLTGIRPFGGDSTFALMQQIIHLEPPAPSTRRQGVPVQLDAIVARALAKRRDDRFGSWAEFAGALEQLLQVDSDTSLSDAEKFTVIRRLSFFRDFTDVELWEVVARARWRKYEPGDVLITKGDMDQSFFVLASGLAKVQSGGTVFNAVSPGECIGEMAYARRGEQPRTADVSALQPSWAISLTPEDLATFSDGCRGRFSAAFLYIMADRISMLSERLLHSLQAQKIGMV